jgi:hypothetical protein
LLSVIEWYIEKEVVFLGESKENILRISSYMSKYDTKYKIRVDVINFLFTTVKMGTFEKYTKNENFFIEETLDVQEFFDCNGNLHFLKLQNIFESLINKSKKKSN